MKGITPLFLGILGTFAFSWLGLIVIPNAQIGRLDPQTDEEGADAYPMPKSGMAERGRQVYIANGCVYCHSQQVRPAYAASDIDREWGQRRSAPRDYLFEQPAMLGKMRMGPDLANVGHRAPADDETAPEPAATGAAPAAAPAAGAPAPGAAAPAAGAPAAVTAAAAAAPAPAAGAPAAPPPPGAAAAPAAVAAVSPAAGSPPAAAAAAPATAAAPAAKDPAAGAREATTPPAPAGTPADKIALGQGGPSPAPATTAQTAVAAAPPIAPASADAGLGDPSQYSAAWHHRHLYDPRSITLNSTMPSFAFLYEKRRIAGSPSADALRFAGQGGPEEGWEIVPTPAARDLVAYLMSLDQSHALNEVKTPPAAAPAAAPADAAAAK